jgi:DNA-binding beta-propeller fold protein YncE
LAVNSSTNSIFVVGYSSSAPESFLLSIDGKDLTVSSTSLQYESFFPFSGIAVNERTNKVYLGGFGMKPGIAVVDGADLSSRMVPTGNLQPVDIAVNPDTNQTLALCTGGGTFLVTMDGATERFESFDLDDLVPGGIAVNRFTNRIYVVDSKFPGSQILVFAPDGCSSTTTSLDELRGEVETLSTAKRVIRSLTSLLDDVELALDQDRPDLGRSRLALFQRKLVTLSNPRTGGASSVPLHEANRLLCSASNVLLGVEKP